LPNKSIYENKTLFGQNSHLHAPHTLPITIIPPPSPIHYATTSRPAGLKEFGGVDWVLWGFRVEW